MKERKRRPTEIEVGDGRVGGEDGRADGKKRAAVEECVRSDVGRIDRGESEDVKEG